MMETLASVSIETIISAAFGLLLGIVGFFLSRFFSKTDKIEDHSQTHVTHIALIHEKIGTHAASEQKQWAVIDGIIRDVAELKIKVAVLERERDRDA